MPGQGTVATRRVSKYTREIKKLIRDLDLEIMDEWDSSRHKHMVLRNKLGHTLKITLHQGQFGEGRIHERKSNESKLVKFSQGMLVSSPFLEC